MTVLEHIILNDATRLFAGASRTRDNMPTLKFLNVRLDRQSGTTSTHPLRLI